jgi:hypothetical protein
MDGTDGSETWPALRATIVRVQALVFSFHEAVAFGLEGRSSWHFPAERSMALTTTRHGTVVGLEDAKQKSGSKDVLGPTSTPASTGVLRPLPGDVEDDLLRWLFTHRSNGGMVPNLGINVMDRLPSMLVWLGDALVPAHGQPPFHPRGTLLSARAGSRTSSNDPVR